jgi:hypothetical protein
MGTGTLTLAYLLLTAGATPDIWPINQSNIRIPIHVDPVRRPLIKQLILYASSDEGRTWKQVDVASPDRESFTFAAPTDGLYWFTVVVEDPQGNTEPKDIYKVPPSQKILIDTLKPQVKITAAERQGDDIVVNWEIQEDHPDLATLKLEYQTADGRSSSIWYTAPLTNPPLIGQARFRLASPGAVTLRVQIQDTAGNVGSATRDLPAIIPPAPTTPVSQPAATPTSLQATGNSSSAWDNNRSTSATPLPRNDTLPPAASSQPPASAYPQSSTPYQTSATTYQQPTSSTYQQPTSNYQQQAPSPSPESSNRLVASSENIRGSGVSSFSANSSQGPPVTFVKDRQVAINYEVDKVGPSGLGKVTLWMTQDDGRTWRYFADNPNLTPPITVDLPGEGVYGFRIVVESKAGLGKRGPVSGDPPEMRIECDLTPPVAQLYAPEPDPHQRNALTITWNATDKNLTSTPISLWWAERKEGEWHEIHSDLPNTGRYSWLLPPNLPFRVFMKLMVRDSSGNVSVAETSEPVLVDLSEPEGRITGLATPVRRP